MNKKITKQVTISAGQSGYVNIDIPSGRQVLLKGYGYTWFASNKYSLTTGNVTFPSRTDQEGSPSIPRIFGIPYPCRSGGYLRLYIENGDSGAHTYDVVFYILSTELLNEESTGGDLNLTIGGSSGGVASTVSISNNTNTTFADVIARGDGKNALCVDTELSLHTDSLTLSNVFVASPDGSVGNANYMKIDTNRRLEVVSGEDRTPTHSKATIGTSSTTVIAANANRKALIIINDGTESMYIKLGASAVMAEGIRINANGGAYELSKELGNLYTGAINGICASGNMNVLVTQFV
ncbi:hypothetical protein [Methanosarcina horonobensis]|uniref:hypothetical protein n=1 Tax=Methanosarcina horonobensis TaxID=418008 RepID=UPI000A926199|nr:hypothetical protein [Methanosarcina horonobensis]